MANLDVVHIEDVDDPHAKVSRLPPLPMPLDPVVAELFEHTRRRGGDILNLHKVSCHAPKLTRAKRAYTYALRNECDVPRIYRELAICRTAINVDCAYELHHHHPFALAAGLSQAQFQAIRNWREKKTMFDAKQRAILAYVDELTLNAGIVEQDTFDTLAHHFNAQEIVELTYCATSYYASGMFMKALAIEPDGPQKKAAPGRF